jgi:hypothetical protein
MQRARVRPCTPVQAQMAHGMCRTVSVRVAAPIRARGKSPDLQSIRPSLATIRLVSANYGGILTTSAFPARRSGCLRSSIGE